MVGSLFLSLARVRQDILVERVNGIWTNEATEADLSGSSMSVPHVPKLTTFLSPLLPSQWLDLEGGAFALLVLPPLERGFPRP